MELDQKYDKENIYVNLLNLRITNAGKDDRNIKLHDLLDFCVEIARLIIYT